MAPARPGCWSWFKAAVANAVPAERAVMDHLLVMHLAADRRTLCRVAPRQAEGPPREGVRRRRTYGVNQEMIDAYKQPWRQDGKIATCESVRSIHTGVHTELPERARLGRSLRRSHRKISAYFDVGASNGPINRGLEHPKPRSLHPAVTDRSGQL